MTVLRILFATAFVYCICMAAGHLLFRPLRLRLFRTERNFLAFLSGAAMVSTLVFALAGLQLIYTWVLGAMGFAILMLWYFFGRGAEARSEPGQVPLSTAWRVLFWGPFLVYAWVYFTAAMMPEISPDGTVYHVGLVVRYYEHRGFFPLRTEMYSGLSGGIEMLFLVAFAFGRHSAAAMVHLLFLLSMPFGMMAWARRNGSPRAGIVGALLFFISPVVGMDGSSAYIDVAAAAVLFGAFCALEIWRTENSRGALAAAGLLAGFGYAAKFTAGIAAVCGMVCVVVICYRRRMRWRNALQLACAFSLPLCLTAGPWIVKDILQFDNPFYPLFNAWFPNPWQYPMVEAQWRDYLTHMNGITPAQIPWQAIMGGRLDGIIGPAFFLAPLALLSLRTRPGRRLLLAFIALFLPYFGNIGARFLIAPLPFLALALALGAMSIPRIGPGLAAALAVVHAVASWPAFIDRWLPSNQWRVEPGKISVLLRRKPEKQFLEEHWPDYKAGLLLDRYVPPSERVLSPGMGQMAYQHREVLGTFDSAAGRRAWDTVMTAVDPVREFSWIRELSFPRVAAQRIRIVTDSSNENDFSINELRFYKGDAELARSPAWRLSASSYPWGVQLAFDNSSTSWWTSGQKEEPGTWIAVDFGAPAELDRIELEQIVDQRWTKIHAEVFVRGLWRDLEAHETGAERPPSPDLRMNVRDELKAMGIRWILMPDNSPGAADMREHALYWGITQKGEANGYRLWRLD